MAYMKMKLSGYMKEPNCLMHSNFTTCSSTIAAMETELNISLQPLPMEYDEKSSSVTRTLNIKV